MKIAFFAPGILDVGKKAWSSSVIYWARQAGAKLVSCPVCVRCLFVLPRNATAPDRGMLLRCVLDALRGVAWVDDRQVVSEIVDIEYGDIPGVEISVSAADRRSNPA